MKKYQDDELRVVYGILSDGASGQMHAGDTIGLWTFNREVYSDLPMQQFTGSNMQDIGDRTLNFLKGQKFAKSTRFDRALADMRRVIKASDFITVFIISSGKDKMTGTPFDNEINALYKQALADMKSKPRPVVTVLQAKEGRIVKYTVNAVPWPVVVPEIPIPIRKTPPQVAEKTNRAAASNAPAHRPTAPPLILSGPKPTNPPPQAPQNPVAAAPPVTHPPPAATNAPAPATTAAVSTPPTNLSVPPAPAPVAPQNLSTPPPLPPQLANTPPPPPPQLATLPVLPQQKPAAPVAPAPTPAPRRATPPPPVAENGITPHTPGFSAPLPSEPLHLATNAAPPAPVKASNPPVAVAPTIKPLATNSSAAQATAFVPTPNTGRSKGLLLGGMALLGLGLAMILLMLRRSRATNGPSLISETMGNGQKGRDKK